MIPLRPVNILLPVNNFEPVIILEPGGRRRPSLYALLTLMLKAALGGFKKAALDMQLEMAHLR